MTTPFPTDPVLTAIAIAYRNGRLIADDVLPRTPVGRQDFKWHQHHLADGFTLPDTKVGRKSAPNQVEFGHIEKTSSTEDYGLDAPVPQADIDAAAGTAADPLGTATQNTTDLILLDREVRTSRLVFNAASYAASNIEAVGVSDKWSNPASKPLNAITDALDQVIMRPNIGIFGRAVSTALRRHPQIVKAYHGNSGDDGLVPLGFLAELFELDAIYVGEARLNIARPGQNVTLQRVWGPHAAFIYRDRTAGAQSGATFGLTAQWGGRIAGQVYDKDIGLRGGVRVRVGESVKELITAPDLGFYFPDVIG